MYDFAILGTPSSPVYITETFFTNMLVLGFVHLSHEYTLGNKLECVCRFFWTKYEDFSYNANHAHISRILYMRLADVTSQVV